MKTMFRQIVITASIFMSLLIYQNALAVPTSFTGIENYGWFTRDTVHHLDFLDVNVGNNAFVNKTWSYFESGLNYGGRQWRLATVAEVCAIWNLATPLAPDDGGQQYYPGNYNDPYISELGGLFGWTITSGSYDSTSGWTSTQTDNPYPEYYVAGLWDQKAPYGSDWYYTTGKGTPGASFQYTGAWLVAPAPVPEPSTMLLLGSGLIGLAGYGRKKFFKK